MANLVNPALTLLQARPLQHGNVNSASIFKEIRFLQPNNLFRKSDAASAKVGRRSFRCKAQNCGAPHGNVENARPQKSKVHLVLASVSSSGSETASVGASSPVSSPPPPPTTYIGSPLLWIGVGVGISALFSWVASSVKRYAMQQFLKTIMGQTTPISQPGGMPMPAGSGFPIPPFPVPPSIQTSPTPPQTSPQTQTVDVSATEVTTQSSETNGVAEKQEKPRKPAFVDVSPDEVLAQHIYAGKEDSTETISAKDSSVSQGQAFTQAAGETSSRYAQSTGKAGPILTVESLEKMMEDPTVQKMVYPYLPQEMQNPATFKWMMQNPEYRQQLEEMLNNMGGDAAWNNQMMESLKSFDLNSQDVKQQFEQIGLTPEEVISKIMANPDVAMAFQNPRVQAAIMDCSQNPLSITKYQNDKEVMDVFNKISELFPGMAGSP